MFARDVLMSDNLVNRYGQIIWVSLDDEHRTTFLADGMSITYIPNQQRTRSNLSGLKSL